MLHCAYSKQTERWGVVDDYCSKLIIPFCYARIEIQKYGIVAYDQNNIGSVYGLDGTPIVRAMKNVLLLENNTLITSGDDEICYIVDYSKRNYLCKYRLSSILFFCGSNEKAEKYDSKKDLSSIFTNKDYLEYGAHLENLVCICSKENKLWGVYNISNGSLHSNFIYKILVQCSGQRIGGITTDGKQHNQI